MPLLFLVILGASMIYGLRPGPLMFAGASGELVRELFAIGLLTQILMVPAGYLAIRTFGKVFKLPNSVIMPMILVFCIVGSYALNFSVFDVGLMFFFGLLGFYMERNGIPLPPLVLAIILGPLIERNLRLGLMQTGGSLLPFFTRPISIIVIIGIVVFLGWNQLSALWRKLKGSGGSATSQVGHAVTQSRRSGECRRLVSPGSTVTSPFVRGSIGIMNTAAMLERKLEWQESASARTATLEQYEGAMAEGDYDVVVIGAGFAGLTAAIEAHNCGASVLVLEKMKAPGGNSIISDGGIAAAGTALQRRLNIEDSPELMFRDMMRAGMGLNHPELVRVVAESSAEVVDWSVDYLGVEYLDRLDQFGGHSVARCFTAMGVTGATIIRRQVEKLHELGIELRPQACLQRLLTDGAGRVWGLQVREGFVYGDPEEGCDVTLRAHRAVVLATGGFGADIAFRSVQDPRLTRDIDTTNKLSATAEALVAALRIGAMPVHLSHIQLGPWASPDEKGYGVGPRFADYVVFQYGVVVSPVTSGRIVNELGDRKTVADAILAVGQPCVGIADARAVRESGWSIDRCLERGVVRQFADLHDLATFYELDAPVLASTIERFNCHMADGADPDFGKPVIEAWRR